MPSESSSSEDALASFDQLLFSLPDITSRIDAAHKYLESIVSSERTSNTRVISPDSTNTPDPTDVAARKEADKILEIFAKHNLTGLVTPTLPKDETPYPVERLQCANVDVSRKFWCSKFGTLKCSGCCLVCYCSQECAKAHWKTHKKDCKDPLRSDRWVPSWIRERRKPKFVESNPSASGWGLQTKFGMCQYLWGNVPAFDVLNLSKNEGVNLKKDLSLAFIASGDLRNVVTTINALPEAYDGELRIVLNDQSPLITSRNLVLLLLLATFPDEKKAAELALHTWYSAFLTHPSVLTIAEMMSKIFLPNLVSAEGGESMFSHSFGAHGKLSMAMPELAFGTLVGLAAGKYDLATAANNFSRIMMAEERVDYVDRYLGPLRPSHRVSFMEYRKFGLVLPFGGVNAHFNTPNRFLFAPDGRWLLNDSSSPLESWNIDHVIESGAKHGCSPEDLYGCLYFHLSDELRKFYRRLQKFKISIHLFGRDAIDLGIDLKSGIKLHHLPKGSTFDRVEVSNIVDSNYVGFGPVLSAWGPLLNKKNPCSSILGYSMNWLTEQKGGQPESKEDLEKVVGKLMREKRIPIEARDHTSHHFFAIMAQYNAAFDNSKAFGKYLEKYHVAQLAQSAGLKIKSKPTILPPRFLAPIEGPFSGDGSLPSFPTDESWYRHAFVSGIHFSERFVEFGLK